jgi:hypothetical protein
MNAMQMPSPAAGAGLGAMIQAKGTAGAGAPKKTMNEMMALADKLPDSELADVLSGKSVRVPQFAAMLAAMGRESLRKAVAGAQAGQAKEPSRKDQMLARMQPQAQPPMPPQAVAGLASLPAPNMETVSAAEGGIIGYSGAEGSSVEDPLANLSGNSPDAMAADRARVEEIRARRAAEEEEMRQRFLRQAAPQMAAPTPVPEIEDPRLSPTPVGREPIPSSARPPGATPSPSAPGIAPPFAAAPERRKSFLDGLEDNSEDVTKRIAQGKSQAQGEFLLQLGASLMGTQNLGRALQQGIQNGLPGIVANRKEANALVKEQRDYRLNMAKAKEAAAQGNDDLTFKYAKLAEDSKYQAGMVGAAMARGGGNLTAKQYDSARKAADTALDNELKRLGPRARLMTPEQRDAFRAEAFNRTLQAIQSGVMPQAPGPQFQEPPSGAVTRP